MKFYRVDNQTTKSLVQAQDLPEALEKGMAGNIVWKIGTDDITFDNVVMVKEVTVDNTTEGL